MVFSTILKRRLLRLVVALCVDNCRLHVRQIMIAGFLAVADVFIAITGHIHDGETNQAVVISF